ncbi:MAG: hypothetical protein ACLTLQ_05740 [[Clostridium] scindens]
MNWIRGECPSGLEAHDTVLENFSKECPGLPLQGEACACHPDGGRTDRHEGRAHARSPGEKESGRQTKNLG